MFWRQAIEETRGGLTFLISETTGVGEKMSLFHTFEDSKGQTKGYITPVTQSDRIDIGYLWRA
jgi:hypothetical protein